MNKDSLLSDYVGVAQKQMEYTYTGDFRKGNLASDKLKEYNDEIKSNFSEYEKTVYELITSNNPNACIWISNVALDKEFEVNLVIQRLKEIASTKELGIIGFNAKMVLKSRKLM